MKITTVSNQTKVSYKRMSDKGKYIMIDTSQIFTDLNETISIFKQTGMLLYKSRAGRPFISSLVIRPSLKRKIYAR